MGPEDFEELSEQDRSWAAEPYADVQNAEADAGGAD